MRIIMFTILLMLIISTLIANDIQGDLATMELGERPFIDIRQIDEGAMQPGLLRIQLHRAFSNHLSTLAEDNGQIASFELSELDELNLQLGISRITRLFASPALNKDFSWRHRQWGLDLWFELHFENPRDLREMVLAYRELDSIVSWAEPVYKKRLTWTPNDPYYGNQWHYHNTGQQGGTVDKDIDLPEAWNLEKGHPDVIVAIIDGGIQTNHPDLSANIWSSVGYNFVDDNSTIVPHDHGTHVAGTVAAVNNNSTGVAGIAGGSNSGDGVRLMSCQVFTNTSSGGFHLAPIYAADNGAAISQNSWGYEDEGVYNQAELTAIDYFNANGGGSIMNGGITIFAAGNDNDNGAWYPAYYSGAFSVAATNNQDIRSYYSNYGTWVDVSAPGGETNSVGQRGVLSTVTGSGYSYYQGTSMACPHVSGVVALVLSLAHRNSLFISNTDLKALIKDSTDDHYGVNPSYIGQLGTGRVNAYAALMSLDLGQPSVQITNPAPGSVLDAGSAISVQVDASDSDGSIVRVEFFVDDTLMHTDLSSPYSWLWDTDGYATGSYELKAEAVDNENQRAEYSMEVFLLAAAQEGFESGSLNAYNWINNSPSPWTVQGTQAFSGSFAAQSGSISDNQSSTLSISLDILSPGEIVFARKVSSEENYDFLEFYIDDELEASWSGEQDWVLLSYPVAAGSRTFSWTYSKDMSVSSGEDAAWIDHIIFPEVAGAPQITLSDDELNTTLAPDTQDYQSFTLGNSGESPLHFSISMQELSRSRSIEGSTLSLDLPEYSPGTTLDLIFSVHNASSDDEWLTDVVIHFPAGVSVNSVSDFVGGSGGDMSPDQISGDGITITWHGSASNGFGYIHPDESAEGIVNVSISPALFGELGFPYEIHGDIYGGEPHSLYGTITVPQEVPPISWLSLSTQAGSVAPSADLQIDVAFDASDLEIGNYAAVLNISSNDPSQPNQEIEVYLEVAEPNTAPTLQLPDSFSFDMNDVLIVDFAPFVNDDEGDELYLSGAGGSNVLYSIDNLEVTFEATPDWYGSEVLTFSISDGELEDSDTVMIIVNRVITELDSPELTIFRDVDGILLAWNSVADANSYDIYRSMDPEQGFAYLANTPGLSYLDQDANSKAFYRVIAVYEEAAK